MINKRGKLNKKGADFLFDQIIFIIIILAFSVIMIVFVVRFGNQATIKEQIYAKQVALAIDKARVGTEIKMDISEFYNLAQKNKFNGKIIDIDNKNKKVMVFLSSGEGYSYNYFSGGQVSWNIDNSKKGEEKLIFFVSE
jgi:hypothetical protein